MNHRKVAVIGSTGQLGTDLVDVLSESEHFDVVPLRHEDADCTDSDAVRKALFRTRPQIVVNCAASVRVDDCEDRADEAFQVNAIGALNIAKACAELDALCIYISSDYVFDGTKATPYVESDPANPINVYGTSKLAGEYLVRQAAPRWLIVRMASLFGKAGARGKGGNFIETILAKARKGEPLQVVNDIRISPIYARDAAEALVKVIEADGVLHLTNGGACTWYEFAQQALDLAGLRVSIDPVSSNGYPARARRPANSVLESTRFLVKLRSWQDALAAYMGEQGHMTLGQVGQLA